MLLTVSSAIFRCRCRCRGKSARAIVHLAAFFRPSGPTLSNGSAGRVLTRPEPAPSRRFMPRDRHAAHTACVPLRVYGLMRHRTCGSCQRGDCFLLKSAGCQGLRWSLRLVGLPGGEVLLISLSALGPRKVFVRAVSASQSHAGPSGGQKAAGACRGRIGPPRCGGLEGLLACQAAFRILRAADLTGFLPARALMSL